MIELVVIRAGVQLEGEILKTSIVPTLSLIVGPSGGITVCFDVSVELRPLTITFQGIVSYLACIDFIEVCCGFVCFPFPILVFCDPIYFDIFRVDLALLVLPVFDVCVTPVSEPLEVPAASRSVQLQQLGREVAVAWDACQSQSVIDKCVR